MAGVIVVLVLLILLVAMVFIAYIIISNKIRNFSKSLFGTENVAEGIRRIELENEQTPKTVAATTSLYLPRIQKDFPEFDYNEMKARAENVLYSYLRSIDEHDARYLTEGTDELIDSVSLYLGNLDALDQREHYKDIKLHRLEIHKYIKIKGRCSVVFQGTVQYKHYIEKDGKIIKGKPDRTEQGKFNIHAIYIQDQDVVENREADGFAMVCPNCGAPLTKLGAKVCAYCDTPIVEFNIRIWSFGKVEEIKV